MTDHHLWRSPEHVVPQDWPRLAGYLAERGQRLDLASPPMQFGVGLANLNYRIIIDGQPVVLRRPPAGDLAEGANDLDREFRVMSALHRVLPLVPEAKHLCSDTSVLGAPFELIEYRAGIPIGSRLPEHVAGAPDTVSRLASSLIDTMAAVHAVDPDAIGLGDLGRPEGFLDRQVTGWGRRATAVYPNGCPSSLTAALDHLRAHPFREPADVCVLHCDFKLNNVLVDERSLRPVAVVDWDMGTRGDPLFDLAVFLSYWIEPDDPTPIHAIDQMPSLEPGAPTRADLVSAYFQRTGREPVDLGRHLVLARIRLAVAWMQLYRHWERGTVTDPRCADFERVATAVLDWTADTLHHPE